MKNITAEIAKNKKILIRLDLDVPMDNFGNISDTTRLSSVLPTLELLSQNAAQIIIIGHLGRPEGSTVENLRLKPVADSLKQFIGSEINYINTWDNNIVKESLSQNHKWNLLENLRFDPREETNDDTFAQQLADYAEIFIFEAFAVSHRKAASTVAITTHLPSYAGLRVAKEIEVLSEVIEKPQHPLVVIIGGAKIETKLPTINYLQPKADSIIVGGKLVKEIHDIGKTFETNVFVMDNDGSGFDITQESLAKAKQIISEAQMIVWNGPVGKFEDEGHRLGTKEVTMAVATSQARKIIGGGDTISAVSMFGVEERMDFISVGGGAMLEFLSGKELPALKALE